MMIGWLGVRLVQIGKPRAFVLSLRLHYVNRDVLI